MNIKRLLRYVAVTLLIISLPLSAFSAKDNIDSRIAKGTETLNKLNNEIVKNKTELARLKKMEDSITNRLNTIDRKIKLTDNEIAVLKIDLDKNRQEGERIRGERGIIQKNISDNSELLSKHMIRLHKEGHFSFLKAVLTSKNFSDFLRRAKYSRILAKEEARVLRSQREEEKKFDRIQIELNSNESKIKNLIEGISSKKVVALEEQRKKKGMLEDIAVKREVYLKHKEEAEKAAKDLSALLGTLKRKEKTAYVPQKGSTNFANMRGKLPWPISGKIISPFGKIKNPKFNVYTFNNGIEIQTRPDLEVKAIHDGQVIFADWFKGYGKLVIVDNGGGYYSLYGHLDKIEAPIGKNIYSGNVLGYSGETGSINGYTLYFEIRKDGKPVNPLIWLNKNRRVA
ncbi:MAG: peptidoglycan DD-metalloendopeptidase family protein [Nitrospinae bacterium]|nr:peptidoglycan DD-metalloendopeptidase family protein [Nitrospinota bacterium]